MKGISSAIALVFVFITIIVTGIVAIGGSIFLASIAAPAVPVAVDFDGEFDDAFLPTEGFWSYNAVELTDCNITSNYLGGSDYSSCVYDTYVRWAGGTAGINGSVRYFSIVLDVDGPVEKMDIEAKLQNTGTCKPDTDGIISDARLYRYDDDVKKTEWVVDMSGDIDNQKELDAEIAYTDAIGNLVGDEYVLWLEVTLKNWNPDCADGDDIMKIDIDLDTSEDADAARILWQSA